MSYKSKIAIKCSEQRWIPQRMRRSVIKRIHPEMLKNYSFKTIMMNGLYFSGNLVNYIDRMIYFCGAHEKYMLNFLSDLIPLISSNTKNEIVFFDVGANAGNHTLFMSPLIKQVYAFEPFNKVRFQLENNIANNNLLNIKTLPYGLSNKNETLPFFAGPDENLGASSFKKGHYSTNKLVGEGSLNIGDEFVENEQIDKVHIIKADVEGFEEQVLKGLKKTIFRDDPVIIIELSETTRKCILNEKNFKNLFPENYSFYYFKHGSNDTGKYKIADFDYNLKPKLQDVIAIPSNIDMSKF